MSAIRIAHVALCAGHRGFFDASLKPVLTIDSGDVVRLETSRDDAYLLASAAMDL